MINNLPERLLIKTSKLDMNLDIDEAIADYLSNQYGFCVYHFSYYRNKNNVKVINIMWDLKD